MTHFESKLPQEGQLFREGYLWIHVKGCFSHWKRRFFILEDNVLTWWNYWGDEKGIGRVEISADAVVKPNKELQAKNRPFAFILELSSEPEMIFEAESEPAYNAWTYCLKQAIHYSQGESVSAPKVRARFFECDLYKTPPDASKWEMRHFQVEDGEVSYWQSQGKNKKGTIFLDTANILPKKTQARGVPAPFPFQIVTSIDSRTGKKRVYNLCAQNEDEFLNVLQALKAWTGISRPSHLTKTMSMLHNRGTTNQTQISPRNETTEALPGQ